MLKREERERGRLGFLRFKNNGGMEYNEKREDSEIECEEIYVMMGVGCSFVGGWLIKGGEERVKGKWKE